MAGVDLGVADVVDTKILLEELVGIVFKSSLDFKRAETFFGAMAIRFLPGNHNCFKLWMNLYYLQHQQVQQY